MGVSAPSRTKSKRPLEEALVSGEAEITMSELVRGLEGFFSDPELVRQHPHFTSLQQPGHWDKIDDACVAAFTERGFEVSEAKRRHLDLMDSQVKEKVREVLVSSVLAGKPTVLHAVKRQEGLPLFDAVVKTEGTTVEVFTMCGPGL